ncbi:hypothetical protein RFI_09939 [Reticulomyxa filosa]|uniref:Uncharacterized protein n=1 Tax=Reticulomyxa filosa TaxID=46433 RepID=X6NME4_RETFI|nr:hypothetical protein RFI_09939 [Reticulomyxa filosa]|eukprot:ETO27191.1 hypothetical protein RFI_09939 [Reticulomyxa filosa]
MNKPQILEGIEYMLKKLQLQATNIEKARYDPNLVSNIPSCYKPPIQILGKQQTINEQPKKKLISKYFKNDSLVLAMNWWDQPFRDHLHEAKRPIIREAGIEQFASEYMLAQLREQEEYILYKRQKIECERVRPPKKNWHEIKGRSFGRELQRYHRQKQLYKQENNK